MNVAAIAARDCIDEISCALDRLAARAAQYYSPRAQAARILVVVKDSLGEHARMVRLGASVEAQASADAGAAADAVITVTHETLEAILASPTTFDARSRQFDGLIAMTGDTQAAQHLLQLLKRPSEGAMARLARARAHAPERLPRVPELSGANVDARTVLDAVLASRPLVVRSALDWPACGWSLDEFASRYGDAQLAGGDDGRVVSMRGFIASLQAACASTAVSGGESSAPYTHGCLLPPMLEPLFPFPYFKLAAFSSAQIWAGARRDDALVTRLHCDVTTSFLAQVHGRKRVRLFSPTEHERLYAMPSFNFYQPCCVDAGRPDFARFPEFAKARYVDVVVGPGDLLIVPTGWYHCVWALDHVLSVSRFLVDELAAYFFA